MKKITVLLVAMLSFLLVSCGVSGASKKAVEEGKVATVSKEYKKARDLFKLAVDEDSKNSEAKLLLDLLNDYIDLTKLVNTGEFDKTDELVSRIEENEKMELIKDDFQKTKDSIADGKESISKYSDEIADIEGLLKDGKLDEAKTSATTKLEEVKGIKVLEDKLNSVISSVDEKIANAKAEILKYYKGEYDIKYKNMEIFSNDSAVTELKGKAILKFVEDQQYGSPQEYMYRIEDGAVFQLNQGSYYWVSNGYKEIYSPTVPKKQTAQQNQPAQSNDYVSKDEAVKIASKKFEEDFPAEVGSYKAVCNGNISAGAYEVEMYDKGGRLFFATYVVDAKSGTVFRN